MEQTKTKAEKDEKEAWKRAFGFNQAKENSNDEEDETEDVSILMRIVASIYIEWLPKNAIGTCEVD